MRAYRYESRIWFSIVNKNDFKLGPMAVEMPLNGDEYHDKDGPGINPAA